MLAAVLALQLAVTAPVGSNVLQFDTHGGDAWTFSKVISGTVIRGSCDTVTLVNFRARVTTRPAQGRFTATIPLREGRNTISALCLRKGRLAGPIIRQTWTERLGKRDTTPLGTATNASNAHPDWRSCTILYGVAPGLLGQGGLRAITARLGQISRLGVTALWLAPVTGAPPGDFGYALTDPFQLRADLGSSSDLRALIARAHALGIRVLLDFVTNHLSSQHPYFVDTVRFGRRSPYFDWFERDRSGQPMHYFDWSSLENLNYDNPEVRNYVLAALTHWFRAFRIDGFRADAAWAVRERDPGFWPLMHRDVASIDPGALLLAEASARDSYYMSHGFDVAYDWTGELGHWAWEGIFGPPGQVPNLAALREALTNEGRGFPDNAGVLHFLNNNDTGKRFITVHGAADTRLAAMLLLTLPGVPLIYAGDEVGASFEPYAHPAPIQWNDPDHLLAFYTRLTRLRRELPALRSSGLRLRGTRHPVRHGGQKTC